MKRGDWRWPGGGEEGRVDADWLIGRWESVLIGTLIHQPHSKRQSEKRELLAGGGDVTLCKCLAQQLGDVAEEGEEREAE